MLNQPAVETVSPPITKQNEDIDMEKEKMFLKTIELATNEIQKDKFEHYRIQQEYKKKRNTIIVIIAVLLLLFSLLFFR